MVLKHTKNLFRYKSVKNRKKVITYDSLIFDCLKMSSLNVSGDQKYRVDTFYYLIVYVNKMRFDINKKK